MLVAVSVMLENKTENANNWVIQVLTPVRAFCLLNFIDGSIRNFCLGDCRRTDWQFVNLPHFCSMHINSSSIFSYSFRKWLTKSQSSQIEVREHWHIVNLLPENTDKINNSPIYSKSIPRRFTIHQASPLLAPTLWQTFNLQTCIIFRKLIPVNETPLNKH